MKDWTLSRILSKGWTARRTGVRQNPESHRLQSRATYPMRLLMRSLRDATPHRRFVYETRAAIPVEHMAVRSCSAPLAWATALLAWETTPGTRYQTAPQRMSGCHRTARPQPPVQRGHPQGGGATPSSALRPARWSASRWASAHRAWRSESCWGLASRGGRPRNPAPVRSMSRNTRVHHLLVDALWQRQSLYWIPRR